MTARGRKVPTEPGLQAEPTVEWSTMRRRDEARCSVLRRVTIANLLFELRTLRGLTLIVALLASGACATRAPVRPERPAPTPGAASDPLTEPWIVGPSEGEARQRLLVEAVLRSRIDTVERTDTLRSMLEAVTSRVVSGGVWRLGGLITAFQVGGATPPTLTLPQPFSAELGAMGSQPRLVQPAVGDCSVAGAAAQSLREMWLVPPSRLTTGLTWSDSSRFTVCRDSIPLRVSSVRDYRVLGAERRGEAVVVRVERRALTRLDGEGLQFGERITLSGEGRGSALLTLSLAGGWVVDGQGESELTLRLTGRRRTQELHQTARLVLGAP